MRPITILKSAVGSDRTPGLLQCYKNNGERDIRIVGCDMSDDPTSKFFVDKFYKVPSAKNPNYCDIMLEICKKEHVDIYVPSISAEVSAISLREKEFNDIGVKLSISNEESIRIANDKFETYKFLEENSIAVPKYYEVNSVEDFVEGCKYMEYPKKPVCIKIVDGSGSRGVRIIDETKSRYDIFVNEKPNSFFTSYDEMLATLKETKSLTKMMLVEYMPGNEYTVDLLADNGSIKYIVGRDNTVSVMSIAMESTVIRDEVAYDICDKIVRLLKMHGNIGFDFIRDGNGVPVLMDINPRLTATVSLAAAAGVNLPYLRIKQLLNEKLPTCKLKYGTHLRRRTMDIFTDSQGELIKL